MAKHIEKGRRGEEIARTYLESKSYEILEVNWRHSRTEIDIIARQKGIYIFVEVKTRKSERYGFPEEAVGKAKQENLAKTALAYLENNEIEAEIRFDIVSIILAGEKYKLHHIEDAFFPSN